MILPTLQLDQSELLFQLPFIAMFSFVTHDKRVLTSSAVN